MITTIVLVISPRIGIRFFALHLFKGLREKSVYKLKKKKYVKRTRNHCPGSRYHETLPGWRWSPTDDIAFPRCGHLEFESTVIADGEFKISKATQCLASQHTVSCAQEKQILHSRWNVISTFTEFIWPWRRTLPNWSDVKYVFSWCPHQ